MGAKERNRTNEILSSLDPARERLFRINAGQGWAGRVAKKIENGIVLAGARPLHAAPKGWPDLTGWESIEITPAMVGKRIAVFKAIEIKVSGTLTPEQRRFGELLERMGGIFEVDRGKPDR